MILTRAWNTEMYFLDITSEQCNGAPCFRNPLFLHPPWIGGYAAYPAGSWNRRSPLGCNICNELVSSWEAFLYQILNLSLSSEFIISGPHWCSILLLNQTAFLITVDSPDLSLWRGIQYDGVALIWIFILEDHHQWSENLLSLGRGSTHLVKFHTILQFLNPYFFLCKFYWMKRFMATTNSCQCFSCHSWRSGPFYFVTLTQIKPWDQDLGMWLAFMDLSIYAKIDIHRLLERRLSFSCVCSVDITRLHYRSACTFV